MLVWILQTGEPLNCDGNQLRPMRAINLSKALVSKGHKVEIISTRFFHQQKRFRKNIKNNNIPGIKETLVDYQDINLILVLEDYLITISFLLIY